jgi:hypothetical protein
MGHISRTSALVALCFPSFARDCRVRTNNALTMGTNGYLSNTRSSVDSSLPLAVNSPCPALKGQCPLQVSFFVDALTGAFPRLLKAARNSFCMAYIDRFANNGISGTATA